MRAAERYERQRVGDRWPTTELAATVDWSDTTRNLVRRVQPPPRECTQAYKKFSKSSPGRSLRRSRECRSSGARTCWSMRRWGRGTTKTNEHWGTTDAALIRTHALLLQARTTLPRVR